MATFPVRSLDDAQSRKVVAALQAVGDGRSTVVLPRMDDAFRAELRAQLVAVAPRLVEEGVHPATEAPARLAGRRETRRAGAATASPRPAVRTRPMTVLLSGAAVVVLGLGGATWLARGALPGDALYGLKRTAESVDVSLSGSDLDKGHAQLVDAQKRVEEVSALLDRPQAFAFGTRAGAAGAISDATAGLIVTTLDAADADTHAGVSTIGDDAVTRGDASGLQLVVTWAQGQRDRIDSLVARIPAGSAHDRAETSAAEIRAGLQRATDLLADYRQSCQRGRDEFGPTPCQVPTTTAPGTTPSAVPTAGSTGSGSGGGSGTTTAPPAGTTAAPAPAGTPAATPSASAGGTRATGGTSTSAAPPLTIDSCGVQVSLPVAGVSLGTCTPGR